MYKKFRYFELINMNKFCDGLQITMKHNKTIEY